MHPDACRSIVSVRGYTIPAKWPIRMILKVELKSGMAIVFKRSAQNVNCMLDVCRTAQSRSC